MRPRSAPADALKSRNSGRKKVAGENSAGGVLFHRMQRLAYAWHNYGNAVIGARSDIENVDIGRLQAFYRTYYQPDNAVLIVAGKFDTAAAKAEMEKRAAQEKKLEALSAEHALTDAAAAARDVVLHVGDGALDEEEVPVRIGADDLDLLGGDALVAHVAGHPLALDDAGRVGARPDGSRLAVPGVAVAGGAAAGAGLKPDFVQFEGNSVKARFATTDDQIKALEGDAILNSAGPQTRLIARLLWALSALGGGPDK